MASRLKSSDERERKGGNNNEFARHVRQHHPKHGMVFHSRAVHEMSCVARVADLVFDVG